MKTHSWLGRSAALLCLAATLHFNCARAQDPPKAAETTHTAPAAAKSSSGLSYDLVIEGGLVRFRNGIQERGFFVEATLANVVGALREIWPEANIVLTPEVSKVIVGDLKLHSAHELGEALEALRVASGYRFDWRKGSPNAGGLGTDPATGLPVAGHEGVSSLYVLDLGINSQGNPLERARRMVEVFNMRGYLDQLPHRNYVQPALHEIQEAVLMTLGSLKGGGVPENDQPHFQFHPGTQLLVVTGPPDAIEVAAKVLTALTGQASSGESVLSGAEPDPKQRAAQEAARRRYTRVGPGASPPGQAGPDDPSSAPTNPAPPPR